MDKKAIALLTIAIVFTFVGGLITENIDAPIILGLFWGILPKKEFRALFLINLIMMVPVIINSQTAVSGLYMPIGGFKKLLFPDVTENTTIDYTANDEFNLIKELGGLPKYFGNNFPKPINLIGEFFAAGLLTLALFFGIIISIISLTISLCMLILYWGIYLIFKNFAFNYLPSNPLEFVIGNYPSETTVVFATTANTVTLIIFFTSMFLTHWFLGRIGFYNRVNKIMGVVR